MLKNEICEVVVEKIHQSPTTPCLEVAYLIRIKNPNDAYEFDKTLLSYLEEKNLASLGFKK